MASIADRLQHVRERIASAAAAAGRDDAEITLVAVSKRKPSSDIREAYAAGQRDFGENYAQELRDKAEELADLDGIRWHFIGGFQRNKARLLVGRAALLHSVSDTRHVAAIGKRARADGVEQALLIQLNLAGEQTKSGISADQLAPLLEACGAEEGVRAAGLMTMPPPTTDPADAGRFFAELAALRERHGGRAELPVLSMGMSHDFEVAIAHGSTCVRVGSAIFGPR